MEATSVTCPKCLHQFPLTAAIERPIVEKLQQQLEQKLAEERKKIAAEQTKKAQEAVGLHLADLEAQLVEKAKKLEAAQKEQLALLKQKRELDEQKRSFEIEKAKQIEAERQEIRDEARKTTLEESSRDIQDLHEKLTAKDKKLAESQEAELKLRQEKLKFEEEKKAFELEVARRADAVKEAVSKAKDEEFRLKELDLTKKQDDLKKQLDEMKRKMEQGSQQSQGEVLELELEGRLRACFHEDDVAEVAKGAHGADIAHHVRSEIGQDCGTIIWECKRAKTWSEAWIRKIKDDQLAAKAQIAVIVTTAMPRELSHFECREGIWITTPSLALPLAAALRHQLIEVMGARRAMEGRHEKIEVMYDYISGPDFQAKVRAIIEGFQTMQQELEAEKRVMQNVWKKRGKQIERVTVQAIGMYGDLQGIIGAALPKIENLELAALDHQPDDDSDPHFRFLQDTPADGEHGHPSTAAHATSKSKT